MIETPRLRLRPPRPADAPNLVALMTPTVSRWLGNWPVPFTPGMAEARIAASLDAITAGRSLICVVEHQGTFVGWIGGSAKSQDDLRGRVADTDRGRFGYWLGEPWHGRGFMREAAPAFVAALCNRLALSRVEAACQPANRGSALVLAACGASAHAPNPPRPAAGMSWSRYGNVPGHATRQAERLNSRCSEPSRIHCSANPAAHPSLHPGAWQIR